jgi:NADH:ubiquinone oxidoreductase subunit
MTFCAEREHKGYGFRARARARPGMTKGFYRGRSEMLHSSRDRPRRWAVTASSAKPSSLPAWASRSIAASNCAASNTSYQARNWASSWGASRSTAFSISSAVVIAKIYHLSWIGGKLVGWVRRSRNPPSGGAADYAEPVIGPRFARTRWLIRPTILHRCTGAGGRTTGSPSRRAPCGGLAAPARGFPRGGSPAASR